jgi:hypothetical protein
MPRHAKNLFAHETGHRYRLGANRMETHLTGGPA